MPIYYVEVIETREQRFCVEADSYEAAREDAEILAEESTDSDWLEVDTEIETFREVEQAPPGVPTWSGGAHGDWV